MTKNIESMYLLMYYKKNKQRMKVLGRKDLLRWIKKHPDQTRATFQLQIVELTIADTYEIGDE